MATYDSHGAALALGLLGLSIAAPALAGPVAQSASPNWTGPFLGIQAGYASAKISYALEEIPDISEAAVYEFSDANAVYSLHVGYDQEVGDRHVWGVQLNADWLGFDIDPLGSGGFGSLFSNDFDITLSTRYGILANPSTLIYGRAGLSAVGVSGEAGIDERAHALLPAAVFGAGVEAFITSNVTARIEASYSMPLMPLSIPEDAESFDPHVIKVMAGLSWHLDADKGTERVVAPMGNASSFDGFYVGATGGYNLGSMNPVISTPGSTIGPFASEGTDIGVNFGYDLRAAGLVAGTGIEFTSYYAKFFDPGQNSPLEGSTTLIGSLDASAMLTGRLGYVVSDSALIYGKFGLGFASVTANPDFFTYGSGGTRWLPAHQLGAGFETMIAENASFKIEGMLTTVNEGFVVDLTQTDQATLYPSALTANAGLSWRF